MEFFCLEFWLWFFLVILDLFVLEYSWEKNVNLNYKRVDEGE